MTSAPVDRPESIEAFAVLYKKCVVRDTPLEATGEGVKAEVPPRAAQSLSCGPLCFTRGGP
jgi:hypothetical protein